MNANDLIAAMRAAEADYHRWHEEAERLHNLPTEQRADNHKPQHSHAVAMRDRAESALKTHRAEAYLLAAETVERAAKQYAELPAYLKAGFLAPATYADEEGIPF